MSLFTPTAPVRTPVIPDPDKLIPTRPRRVTSAKVISNLVLLAFGALFVAPLLWLVFASLDGDATAALKWPSLTFDNYVAVTNGSNMRALFNSFSISLIAAVVSTIPSTLAAYAFSRHHIPWKGPILLFILMLSGVPITILVIPIYEQFLSRGLVSLVPAAIFLGVSSMPFSIWITKNFIDEVPAELEEAARLEQASTWQVMRRVVLPLALPGIAVGAIFSFVNAWGNFIVPLVLIPSPSQEPAPVAIYSFIGGQQIQFGQVAAYSVLYALPILLLFLVMSRLFRGGFSLGGALRG